MTIVGKCGECGSDTFDYCCTSCMAEEIRELRGALDAVCDGYALECAGPTYKKHDATASHREFIKDVIPFAGLPETW